MRMAPLAIWCAKLEKIEDLERAVREELSLTHPNETIHEAGICHCIAIRHLLRNPFDTRGAFTLVEQWVKKKGGAAIRDWWKHVENENFVDATVSMGWLKIAWTYEFLYLKKGGDINFLAVMHDVLKRGGDTDTNACIVGAMVGAVIGYEKLFSQCEEQVKILLSLDATKARKKRPEIFSPRSAFSLVEKLVDVAPRTVKLEESIDEE